MRILVTGCAGLYGSHLTEMLLNSDWVECVYGIDNLSRPFLNKPPVDYGEKLNKKFIFKKMDFQEITSKDIDEYSVDVVVHLAAYVSIDESMDSPIGYFMNNEYGTFLFMQNIYKSKKKPAMIYASSPEVYGNPIYTPMDIDHPMYPRSIYAVTKLAAEKHCRALYEWYKYPVIVIRNFNTYGAS